MLNSKTIRLRFVREGDAEFILKLRLDKTYNQYLSHVDSDVEAQRNWIKNYQLEEEEKKQFYFIIERLDGVPCGTIRIYDLRPNSFCWGSWILNENKTRYAAIESAFLVYEFGFEGLGYTKSHFDVRKGNDRVIAFHRRMGAIQVGEDKDNYYFQITREAVMSAKNRLKDKLL